MNEDFLLEIPKNNYFNSFAVAKKEVDDALVAHSTLYGIYERHEKYFNGETSKTLEERKKAGLGWLQCLNYGKAIAKIRQIVIQNQGMVRESLFLSQPAFRAPTKSDKVNPKMFFLSDKALKAQVADHVSYAFSCALEADSRTDQFFMDAEYPALTFGYSALISRGNDWMPDVLHPKHIAFPKGATSEKINRWITFSEIRAEELYHIWVTKRNETKIKATDESSGEEMTIADSYVLEGIEDALWFAFQDKYNVNKGANASGYKEWQDVVSDFKEKYQYLIQNTMDIQIAKIWNRELDGTLSEVWIPYNRDGDIEAGSSLLFTKNHGAVNQNDYLVLIKDSGFTDNGQIAKLRGISKMAVQDGLVYDQTRNMVANKAQMTGMPYITNQGINNNAANSIEITQGFGVLKSGTAFVENQPQFDLSSHLNLLSYQENQYREQTKDFDSSLSGKLSNRPTKGEVQALSSESASIERAKASIKLSDYAKAVKMMLKGLCEAEVQKGTIAYDSQQVFFEKLISKLEPYGIIGKEDCIKVIEAIQYMPIDYFGMSMDTLRTMLTMAETPASRNRIWRLMLVKMGVPRQEIDLHAPYEESSYRSLEDEALVAIENNMFATTVNVVYSDSHDPISHLDGHFFQVDEIFNGVGAQEIEPTTAFKWAANIVEHSGRHLAYLKDHPFYNNRFTQYNQVYENFKRNLVNLRMLAEREQQAKIQMEQQAQQQQEGIDPVQAAKIRELEFKAMKKVERDQFLTGVRMQSRREQQAFNNNLKMQDAEFARELRAQEHQQKSRQLLLQSAIKQIQ